MVFLLSESLYIYGCLNTCILAFYRNYIGDIDSARYKLAKYYELQFTEISLYSSGKLHETKAPLNKLYVPMEWKRVTEAFVAYPTEFEDLTVERALVGI